MANTKIHLMAFEPKGDVKTIVHTVGLPAQLQEAFFRIMPPRNEGGLSQNGPAQVRTAMLA